MMRAQYRALRRGARSVNEPGLLRSACYQTLGRLRSPCRAKRQMAGGDMRTRTIQTTLGVLAAICSCGLAVISFAQEPPPGIPRRGSDPTGATIEGRILLPSGQSADFNVKII